MNSRADVTDFARKRPAFGEFVVMMAALMASNALAIDAMLPALPAIGESLDVGEDNRRQLVITVYLIGFGISQLFYGPLSDRLGRKWLRSFGDGGHAGEHGIPSEFGCNNAEVHSTH